MKKLFYIFSLMLLVSSCVKDITIDLPPYQPKIVVEGKIEPGFPPFVLLSNSLDLFASTSIADLENNFITDAQVFVNNGMDTVQLILICTDSIPAQYQPIVAELLGYSPEELQNVNICAYSTFDPNWFGVVGMTYNLEIFHNGEVFRSTTDLLNPIPLDSIYFAERSTLPGYGYMQAELTDPIGSGDAYRWETRRLNHYSDGSPKDPVLIAPFNSSFDDQFFDGLQFSWYYDNPGSYEDSTIEDSKKGFYQIGDTVVVKWSKVNHDVYEFLRYADAQIANGGSPFASPVNVPSNISNEALGVWAGFSPIYDTVICE
ncbi:MAG: DUF4249 family protein [Crocinitomicaceae bacterium]